jgi:8-oxo-dGTP pyrophosphatase MutT (NUDIX family)
MPTDPDDQEALIISATIIVVSQDHKALILKRLATEERFPNLWTVAGGKLKTWDGDKYCEGFYYYPCEEAACRELEEETGILRAYVRPRLKYLCSIVSIEKVKRLIVSYYVNIGCNASELHIKTENNQEYKWITIDEIDNYKFIVDIGGEIRQVLILSGLNDN